MPPTTNRKPIVQGSNYLPQNLQTGETLVDAAGNAYQTAASVGTVTSVTGPSIITWASPTSTPTGTLNAQSGNKALLSPADGSSGAPDFRALVAADIPNLSSVYDTAGLAATALVSANSYTDGAVGNANNLVTGFVPSARLGQSGVSQVLYKTLTNMQDGVDTLLCTISIPNVNAGAMLQVWVEGSLGDSDSTGTQLRGIVVSRIAGANAKAAIGSAALVVTTTGVTAQPQIVLSLSSVAGGVTSVNTFDVLMKVTRSAGTSDNHYAAALIQTLVGNASGVTIA